VYRGASAFYDVAGLLVSRIETALDASPAGRPERACVVPGDIAWDGCDCGALVASARQWILSDTFPDVAGFTGVQVTPCVMPWLVGTIEVQIIRCAPSPNGDVLEVPCVKLDAAAEVLVADAWLTLDTTLQVLCELKGDEEIVDYVLEPQTTIGPAGGCVGTTLSAQIAVDR
jgi:hypothetical protein